MDYPKIIIIIVNWNGKSDTIECLESVRRIDYPNFEVVVVDNGSKDDSVEVVQKAFPEVALLETGENLGFAGGNNVGIRYALKHGADYLFLLNNDTVVDPQILNSFIDAFPHTGKDTILGAKIYYFSEQNRIWYAGARWNSAVSSFDHIGQGCIDDGNKFNTLSEIDYVCGCALFVSARLLNRIGLLDEEFFLTFEETDLCYRARREGYRCFFVPDAKVWHKISTSFGGEGSPLFNYFLARNRLLWAEKNLNLLLRLGVYKNVLGEVLKYALPPRYSYIEQLNEGSVPAARGFFSTYGRAMLKKYRNPVIIARLSGMRDYILRRFGDCPDSVRLLLRQRSG